jgi:protein disulfide-isomerase
MTRITSAQGLLIVVLALLTSSCGQTTTAQLTAAAPAGPAKEIDWFKGTFEQASIVAAQKNRPLLLYWGAKWCPYCQALRKTVFVRPDFIEKSALFVPVYMDADLPEVQAWIKPFRISGYPTLLITKADHTELARLSGGMDLSLYAGLLDSALQSERPILDVLHHLNGPQECHRIAYNSWDPAALKDIDEAALAALLTDAAVDCRGPDQVRIKLLALNFAVQGDGDRAAIAAPMRELYEWLDQPQTIQPAIDLVAGLDDSIFTLVVAQGADFAEKFCARWVARMQGVAGDSHFGDADKLTALASAISATKALSRDHSVPAAMQASARTSIQTMLQDDRDRYQRGDLVNVASHIYELLDDDAAATDLYMRELPNTRTPFYYMAHLAGLSEKQHRPDEALDWWVKTVGSPQPSTSHLRLESAYVRALMRLKATDTNRIRSASLQLANDAIAAEEPHDSDRPKLPQFRMALKEWAKTPERRAVAVAVEQRLRQKAVTSQRAT